MGILKKVFGGKEEKKTPPAAPRHLPPSRTPARTSAEPPRPGTVAAPTAPVEAESPATAAAATDSKVLIRALGTMSAEQRARAALVLKERHDRQAIRPLMNAYLNYGDPEVLDALASFGTDVTGPASSEAFDYSIMGQRRARLMDILGMTGDQSATGVVRDFVDDHDKEIHVRASTALARLSDLGGIDRLSADLQQGTDPELRTMALRALTELVGTARGARQAIANHAERFMAEGGAIPKTISVEAPRLERPDLLMVDYIVDTIRNTARDMVLVIGSGAGEMARSRQSDIRRALPGHDLYFLTPELAPEEQMKLLEEARDVASTIPEHTVLVIGVVPAPNDSPPLKHFLTTGKGGNQYSVGIIFVDPHEYALLMDWWRYAEDRADVETDFTVVLSASRPGSSAISEEEHLLYQSLPEDQRHDFARALLAHF